MQDWNMALRASIVQRGDSFSDDWSRFRCSWESVDKDQAEKGTEKDGTVPRTVRYGEWTPHLYAQMTFFVIPMSELVGCFSFPSYVS